MKLNEIVLLCICCFCVALSVSAGADDNVLIWQIGQPDNDTSEFAYGPKDYAKYKHPGFFIVGQSDAKLAWPYVQPGTIDGGWAPGTSQTFNILFGLAAAPSEPSRLTFDFVDTHAIDPPKLRIQINDLTIEQQTPKGKDDASVFGDPSKGREHIIAVDVPADVLKAGNNSVSITTVSGSWVLWDAVTFEASEDVRLPESVAVTLILTVVK